MSFIKTLAQMEGSLIEVLKELNTTLKEGFASTKATLDKTNKILHDMQKEIGCMQLVDTDKIDKALETIARSMPDMMGVESAINDLANTKRRKI
jgi:hypothetical protein